MPGKEQLDAQGRDGTLAAFACPNEDCPDFNVFGGNNLSVSEWMGKGKQIRRLYCSSCGKRFSERQGTLMEYGKLPQETVVRMTKCLVHGCSVDATADICDITPRTVQLFLKKAGRRAEDFHRLQLEKLQQPLELVELDEMHGRSAPAKKGARASKLALPKNPLAAVAARAVRGFTSLWSRPPAS
jgi:transposase-like protein